MLTCASAFNVDIYQASAGAMWCSLLLPSVLGKQPWESLKGFRENQSQSTLSIPKRDHQNDHSPLVLYFTSSQPALPFNKLHMIRAPGHNLDLKRRMVMRQCIDLEFIDRRPRDFLEIKAVQKA